MSDTGRRRRSRRFAPLSGYDSIEGMNRQAVLYALASAALFGLSTPAAKLLVGSVHPVVLGGLLYCGAGGGVALLRRLLPAGVLGAPEVTLTRAQLPWLARAELNNIPGGNGSNNVTPEARFGPRLVMSTVYVRL